MYMVNLKHIISIKNPPHYFTLCSAEYGDDILGLELNLNYT